MYASLKSIGAYVPKKILSNADLEKIVDTSDEWIKKRTGISQRRIADKNEATSDLGVNASKIALKRANLRPKDIDCVICATLSPDYLTMPSTAVVISHKLGIHNKPAFDISSACSGFVYLLNLAKAFIESHTYKNILIVGAEKISSFVDYTDRGTCILFGDGAGACVIGQTNDKKKSILDVQTNSNGKLSKLLITPGGGSVNPCSKEVLEKKLNFIKMSGNEVFKIAVNTLANDAKQILKNNTLKADDVDFFIPHQANFRIIESVRTKLKFPVQRTILTVQKYGNTSAASIPMALNDAYEEKKIKNGDLILFDTFGGGLTWGSALVYFDGN